MVHDPSRRAVLGGAVALAALSVTAAPATASAAARPTRFPLPNGWLPEGIAIGAEPYAYLGSRANGALYRADLRSGEGTVLYAGAAGQIAVGLKIDRDGLLYVAGNTGVARVHDSRTGEVVRTFQLSEATGHFINDVTLLGDRAWFTDSAPPPSTASPAAGPARSAPSRSPATGSSSRTSTTPTASSPPRTAGA